MSFNAAELLRETLDSFSIETDLETIDRVQESKKILEEEREKSFKLTQKELLELSNSLRQIENIVEELETDPKRQELKQQIKENANLELDLSKSLKSLAIEKQSLNTKLSHLIDEFTKLENEIESIHSINNDNQEEEKDLNAMALKLLVYRKLGITLDLKSKIAIIFNKDKHLTDFLNYGDEQYSDYFISNYIWDRIGN